MERQKMASSARASPNVPRIVRKEVSRMNSFSSMPPWMRNGGKYESRKLKAAGRPR